tara:strand:+ start:427 stop:591 length:165 start_codon:yes stop_codon:yes gene_type:complete
MKKYTRKLTRASTHTYTVTVPKDIIKKYKWKEKQKLSIVDEGNGKVVIRDWKRQ